MKTRRRLAAALGTLVLSAPPLPAQPEETPAGTFTGRVEVTAVEILIEVRDRQGQIPDGLTAADFEVLEDGVPATVIGLDYPPPPRRRSPRPLPAPAPRAADRAWRFTSRGGLS